MGPKKGALRRLRWVFLAGAVVVSAFSVAILRRGLGETAVWEGPTALAERGPLTINIMESGTIHPREQIIIRNDLERDAKIKFIVDEGKQVKQGELVVELDVTNLEQFLVERRIRVQTAESSLVYAQENLKVVENQGQADIEQAELTYKFAQQDLQKYIDGEFPRLVKAAEAKITLAAQELSRAREMHEWSRKLFEEKYLSRSELQRDELAANKADLDVQLARADVELLKDYTYTRQLDQLNSDVRQSEMALDRAKRKHAATMAQAMAELKARTARYEDEKAELKEDEDEIARAKKYAPIDGMALYASSVEDWDDDEEPIRHGALVNQQQPIIFLPTTAAFNADIKILEVNLRKIAIGMPVRITVDALSGKVFTARVAEIAPVADSDRWFTNPNLKVYNAVISLDSTDPALRNGMSCRVEILVQRHTDAVYVPIQAVTRVNRQPTVYAVEDGILVPRPVEIGLDNSRMVHVLDGLQGGETICLAPPLAPAANEHRQDDPNEPLGDPNQQGEGRS
ncbi:MAG TPA: HlyD family efflux transporter periplasmic adaptor subunit [Sedimentisphaerales bacterium]|nr:HlyD family efflux transporter periplasmic adaptor subunit [Sedimentisphaerales bacterium]